MTLTKEKLKEFIEIYKQEFWIEISEKEALDLCIPLLIITKYALSPNIKKLWEI